MKKVKSLNAANLVSQRPEVYWGKSDPTITDVTDALVEQLKLEACVNIEVRVFDDWRIVTSETDWISNAISDEDTAEELFLDAKGLSVAGGNALRVEYFLYLYVSDLIAWSGGKISMIKGESPNIGFENYIVENFPSKYGVCYSA